jgi:hypothetical protein
MLDWLLIWGLILAPMTALRIYKFGPGEILLIAWMLGVLVENKKSSETRGRLSIKLNSISIYQVANLVFMFVGMMVNFLLYQELKGIGAIFTFFFSHTFMLLFVVQLFRYLETRSVVNINRLLRKLVICGAVSYGILFFYAEYISNSLFGYYLWMGKHYRFRGFSFNPHQIAMITCAGVFLSLYLLGETSSKKQKILYAIVTGIWFWISLSTKSDTMTLCYVICLAYILFMKFVKIGKEKKSSGYRDYLILVLFGIMSALIISPVLYGLLSDFISSAGNGLGRLTLWRDAFGQLIEKPLGFLVGLGPGGNTGHIMPTGSEAEAHNTYVQLCLNSGVLICLFHIYTIVGIIKKPYYKNVYLVSAVLFFLLYGIGGNMNRRVLVWFTYAICAILFEKNSEEERTLIQ